MSVSLAEHRMMDNLLVELSLAMTELSEIAGIGAKSHSIPCEEVVANHKAVARNRESAACRLEKGRLVAVRSRG
ncbi:MAG: hypothetical protein K8U57_08425 [Planctomycetes bacterium]|nr:hypothetical protein [Planctomycetota bacterium]